MGSSAKLLGFASQTESEQAPQNATHFSQFKIMLQHVIQIH